MNSTALRREQQAIDSAQSIPLCLAVLCLDCERVYASTQSACPACASGQSMTLANALDKHRQTKDGGWWWDRRG